MRRLFRSDQATEATLRWGEQKGRWRRADRNVWAEGPEPLTELDRARAAVMATGGVASHHPAGVVHMPNTTARRLAEVAEQARRRPVSS